MLREAPELEVKAVFEHLRAMGPWEMGAVLLRTFQRRVRRWRLLTDHSSTATHQLSREGQRRGFNEEYLGLCAHFGLEARTINVRCPREDGDRESSHGHLTRITHEADRL